MKKSSDYLYIFGEAWVGEQLINGHWVPRLIHPLKDYVEDSMTDLPRNIVRVVKYIKVRDT